MFPFTGAVAFEVAQDSSTSESEAQLQTTARIGLEADEAAEKAEASAAQIPMTKRSRGKKKKKRRVWIATHWAKNVKVFVGGNPLRMSKQASARQAQAASENEEEAEREELEQQSEEEDDDEEMPFSIDRRVSASSTIILTDELLVPCSSDVSVSGTAMASHDRRSVLPPVLTVYEHGSEATTASGGEASRQTIAYRNSRLALASTRDLSSENIEAEAEGEEEEEVEQMEEGEFERTQEQFSFRQHRQSIASRLRKQLALRPRSYSWPRCHSCFKENNRCLPPTPSPWQPDRSSRNNSSSSSASSTSSTTAARAATEAFLETDLQLPCFLSKCSNRWNFDTFALTALSGGRPILPLAQHIFRQYDISRQFNIDWSRLTHCLSLIEDGYPSNPFHNSIHAADVLQSAHCLLQDQKISGCMSDAEKLLCLFAALGHDLYHPGVNQTFLARTNHFLAVLYKSSVLENHHWRCFVSILKESHVFDHLPEALWREYVDIIKVLILSTDMQRQQEYLENFKLFLARERAETISKSSDNSGKLTQRCSSSVVLGSSHAADAVARCSQSSPTQAPNASTLPAAKRYPPHETTIILQILLKCADISNVCRTTRISQKWSERISAEFYNQGDSERRLSLPVTEIFDREKTAVPSIQKGFIQFLAQPLFDHWSQFVGSPLSYSMVSNLAGNLKFWERKAEKLALLAAVSGSSNQSINEEVEETATIEVLATPSNAISSSSRSISPSSEGGFSAPVSPCREIVGSAEGSTSATTSTARKESRDDQSPLPHAAEERLKQARKISSSSSLQRVSRGYSKRLSGRKRTAPPSSSIRRISLPVSADKVSAIGQVSNGPDNRRISLPATVGASITRWTVSNASTRLTIETHSFDQIAPSTSAEKLDSVEVLRSGSTESMNAKDMTLRVSHSSSALAVAEESNSTTSSSLTSSIPFLTLNDILEPVESADRAKSCCVGASAKSECGYCCCDSEGNFLPAEDESEDRQPSEESSFSPHLTIYESFMATHGSNRRHSEPIVLSLTQNCGSSPDLTKNAGRPPVWRPSGADGQSNLPSTLRQTFGSHDTPAVYTGEFSEMEPEQEFHASCRQGRRSSVPLAAIHFGHNAAANNNNILVPLNNLSAAAGKRGGRTSKNKSADGSGSNSACNSNNSSAHHLVTAVG